MGTAIIQSITAGPNEGTFSHASEDMLEAATQTFKKGAPIEPSAGYMAEGSALTAIVGFAEQDGHNVAAGASKVRVLKFSGGQIFEGTLGVDNGGAADLVTLLQTHLGSGVVIKKDTTSSKWYLDTTSTTHAVIVGFRDAVGSANARVYFKVKAAKSWTA